MDKNLIECATCGYPLTKEERAGLTEINGKMHKPWAGLTNEDISRLDKVDLKYIGTGEYVVDGKSVYEFAKAIEAKLKEKNT